MKRLKLFLLLTCIACAGMGQKPAIEYFRALPLPLQNPCDNDSTETYHKQLGKIIDELSQDIRDRQKKVNDYMKSRQQEIQGTMVRNSGNNLTPAQMEKMRKDRKNMTPEEKRKLADELMQQYGNISMEEVQARKKDYRNKDTAAVKRWAEALSTEKMADQPAEQGTVDAGQRGGKALAELSKEVYDINARLLARGAKYTRMLDSLKTESDTAWGTMQNQTAPLRAGTDTILARWGREKDKTEEGGRKVDQQIKENNDMIRVYENDYCMPLSSKYINILNGLLFYLPGTFTDRDRLDELNAEISFRQTGVRTPDESQGVSALTAVKKYAELLRDIQKYRIIGPETVVQSEIP